MTKAPRSVPGEFPAGRNYESGPEKSRSGRKSKKSRRSCEIGHAHGRTVSPGEVEEEQEETKKSQRSYRCGIS